MAPELLIRIGLIAEKHPITTLYESNPRTGNKQLGAKLGTLRQKAQNRLPLLHGLSWLHKSACHKPPNGCAEQQFPIRLHLHCFLSEHGQVANGGSTSGSPLLEQLRPRLLQLSDASPKCSRLSLKRLLSVQQIKYSLLLSIHLDQTYIALIRHCAVAAHDLATNANLLHARRNLLL